MTFASLGDESEVNIGEGLTVLQEVVEGVLHLHLGHHQLDMVLLLRQVRNDCLLFQIDLHGSLLDVSDLSLGLLGARRDEGREAEKRSFGMGHALSNVVVEAAVERVDRLLEVIHQ